jgi:hypothetical protein
MAAVQQPNQSWAIVLRDEEVRCQHLALQDCLILTRGKVCPMVLTSQMLLLSS